MSFNNFKNSFLGLQILSIFKWRQCTDVEWKLLRYPNPKFTLLKQEPLQLISYIIMHIWFKQKLRTCNYRRNIIVWWNSSFSLNVYCVFSFSNLLERKDKPENKYRNESGILNNKYKKKMSSRLIHGSFNIIPIGTDDPHIYVPYLRNIMVILFVFQARCLSSSESSNIV